MASPEFEKFYLGIKRRIALPVAANASIAAIRKNFDDWVGAIPADPDVILEPFFLGSLPALRVLAPEANRQKIVLFFHGGSYSAGSSWSHRDLLARISRASRSVVISIDYRLAPEHPYPAALQDAIASYHSLISHGHAPKDISFVGISAGGGLALSLMLALKEKKEPLPRCGVCMCPWVDLAMTGATLKTNDGKDLVRTARLAQAVHMYCAGHDPREPLISPLYGDLAGLPPLFIQAGGRDILLDENQRFAHSAKNQKVSAHFEEWPEMVHAWHLFAKELPEGREAIQKIGDWLIRHQTV